MLGHDDYSPDQEATPIILLNDDDHDENGRFCVWEIFTAASIGDAEFVKRLITRGADPNAVNKYRWTALMYAANIGHVTTSKLLLDCGGHVDAQNLRGQTPLMLAASCGNENVCNLLINQYNATIDKTDNESLTALFYATHFEHILVVKMLLRAGANPNYQREPNGDTPFFAACAQGNEQIVQVYLELGADIGYQTSRGMTAQHVALRNRHDKTVRLLEQWKNRQVSVKTAHRTLHKTNSNPASNNAPSIVDGHVGLQKFLLANPNFHEQRFVGATSSVNSSKNSNAKRHVFDHNRTLTPNSSTSIGNAANNAGSRPKNLHELLDQLQLGKYFTNFEQHELDLAMFLQMSDSDLKEIGIKLLGPRKKMTNTIARWHQHGPVCTSDVMEGTYANYHRNISEELRHKNDDLNAELTATQELVEKYKNEMQSVECKLNGLQASGKLCTTYIRECKKLVSDSIQRIHAEPKSVEYNLSKIRVICDQILLKLAESGSI